MTTARHRAEWHRQGRNGAQEYQYTGSGVQAVRNDPTTGKAVDVAAVEKKDGGWSVAFPPGSLHLDPHGGAMKLIVPQEMSGSVRTTMAEIGRQAQFATSVALNAVANRGQQATRDHVAKTFILRRRPFVLNTIKRERGVDFATKNTLRAAYGIDPTRDQLALHVDGGDKRSRRGGRVAIPVAIRSNERQVIPTKNRPKALIARDPKVFVVNDIVARAMGRGKNARIRVLYKLKRAVRVRAQLPIDDIAERTISRWWETDAARAIKRALATARP